MKSRWNILGPQFGLCLTALVVSLPTAAVAQPGDTAGSSDTETTPTPATSASASAEATAPAATNTQPASSAEATTPAPATKPATPANTTVETTAPLATAAPLVSQGEAEPTAVGGIPLTVEILPGSGYPQPRIRGLVGGSLWLTMHGLQFPYMAPDTSRNQVRIAISGSIWDDTSYARIETSKADEKGLYRWANQGRGVLRVTPAYTTRDGWFVQGQIESVANIEQQVTGSGNIGTVDDMFVRAGKWNVFDVTVGRYQGWEVYHYGMGLDLNTLERTGASLPDLAAKAIYGLDTYWDRPWAGLGNYAAHVYVTDYFRFEALGQIGTQGANVRGTRPVAVLDLGYLKVKAGWEYGVTSAQKEGDQSHSRNNGFGGAIQFVLDPYIEGGVNAAIGYVDSWTDTNKPNPAKSTTTSSIGGFLNGRIYGPLMLGVGANQTRWNNLLPNANSQSPDLNGSTDWATHFQGFGAVQYSFWDKLFFKFVANYARFHYEDIVQVPSHSYTNKEYGGRLRMMYLF